MLSKPQTQISTNVKSDNMSYQSGFLHHLIMPQNRKDATAGNFGIDSAGVEWEDACARPLHANVDYVKGKSAMNAGALDVYAVKFVRMRWTNIFNERSRIKYDGRVYQIIPETFNANYETNTLQFHMQLVVNDKPTPKPSSNEISGGSKHSYEFGI